MEQKISMAPVGFRTDVLPYPYVIVLILAELNCSFTVSVSVCVCGGGGLMGCNISSVRQPG